MVAIDLLLDERGQSGGHILKTGVTLWAEKGEIPMRAVSFSGLAVAVGFATVCVTSDERAVHEVFEGREGTDEIGPTLA